MTSVTHPPIDVADIAIAEQSVPATLAPGTTLLVALPADIDRPDLPLAVLAQYTEPGSHAIAVTTGTDGSARLEHCLEELSRGWFDRLGVIDTTAGESLTALYRSDPTIHTPVPGDIERTAVAISELRTALSGSIPAPVSLSISSVSPILEETATPPATVLSSFLGAADPADGIVTVGVEYTRHDEATMQSLSALADGVVWVERGGDGELSLEYESTRTR